MGLSDLCDPDKREHRQGVSDEAFQISVLTPTYNTAPVYLNELFITLLNQTYENWTWVITDDGSSNADTIRTLRAIEASDPRVSIEYRPVSGGISAATNAALARASGSYIALVDHDDLLPRTVFESIYRQWQATPDVDLVYTDEAKINLDRKIYDFFLKPAWSPTMLENTMYIGHLSVYRRALVAEVGGFRSAYDGTQDYDLALRLSGKIQRAVHIPEIGYLWRAIPGSTAMSLSEKDYALDKQREAVVDFARLRDPSATVHSGPFPGYWRVDYGLPKERLAPLLSIVIPTAAGTRTVRGADCDLLLNCISSMIKTGFYPNYEFVIVHNGNLSPKQTEYLSSLSNVTLVHYDEPSLNLSKKMNIGVEAARGKYVCLLNDDIEAVTPAAGTAMIAFLEVHSGVGAIAPLCLYEDGRVQHNGIVLLKQGPSHFGIFKEPSFPGHFCNLLQRREVFGVTGALLITRREDYLRVGGFNEELPLNYNDVLFCAMLAQEGLTCVVDPEVKVFHFENASKVGTFKCEKEMLYRLLPVDEDRYFNPGFVQTSPHFDIAKPTDQLPDSVLFEHALDSRIKRRKVDALDAALKFTMAVSVYNQPRGLLNEMLASLLNQTYPNTEIVLLDNGSSNEDTLRWLEALPALSRLKIIREVKNLGIMGGQRKLLASATGDYFLPVDADDFIAVDAVEIMASAAYRHPDISVFYSDEYKSDVSSNKFAPFYKPEFDELMLTNCCYVGHQMMFKTRFLRDIGGYSDDRATWCHDWDSTLRALREGAGVQHVPEQLYAWRINPSSTASAETAQKPEAIISQEFVLRRFLEDRGLSAKLDVQPNKLGPQTGMWALRALKDLASVERVSAEALWASSPAAGTALLQAACDRAGADGWVMVLLQETDSRMALREFSAVAHVSPSIAMVGSMILDSVGNVAWCGGTLVRDGVVDHGVGYDPLGGGYYGELYCQRYVDVVAGANFIVHARHLAAALERLPSGVTADALMIELALAARREGWKIAVTPHVRAQAPRDLRFILPVDRDGRVRESGLALASAEETDRRARLP